MVQCYLAWFSELWAWEAVHRNIYYIFFCLYSLSKHLVSKFLLSNRFLPLYVWHLTSRKTGHQESFFLRKKSLRDPNGRAGCGKKGGLKTPHVTGPARCLLSSCWSAGVVWSWNTSPGLPQALKPTPAQHQLVKGCGKISWRNNVVE